MEEIQVTRSIIKEVLSFINSTPWRGYYASHIENMLERVDQPCELAIVGQVKAGKSSFLNALLGKDLAMVGETEMTATINYFKYGHPKDENHPVRVVWEDGSEEWQTLTFLNSLQGNTKEVLERANKIDHLEYLLDNEILRNVTLVDTPGTGSLVADHEQRANDYLFLGKTQLRKKHNEQTINLKNRADAVIVLTGRVEQSATNELVSNLSQDTSAFNALGVMTKIDLEPETTSNDWSRRCSKYLEMLRQQLNAIVPVSASIYRTIKKLDGYGRLAEIKNALQSIPDEEFEEVCSSYDIFLADEPDINEYFNNYGLSYSKRKRLTEGIDVWMTFYTIARELHSHTVEDAKQRLINYSGMERMKEILNQQFFSRSRTIRCAKIVNELLIILNEINNRYLPSEKIDSAYRNAYLNIIKNSNINNRDVLSAFEQFIEKNICTQKQIEDYSRELNVLQSKVEKLVQQFEGTDKKSEALLLLEKISSSFSSKEVNELEILFGKRIEETVAKDRLSIAKRQSYWRSRKNSSTNNEVNKIIELAIYAYGTIKID